MTLEHGLAFDRVNSIESNGPDENFVDQKRGHTRIGDCEAGGKVWVMSRRARGSDFGVNAALVILLKNPEPGPGRPGLKPPEVSEYRRSNESERNDTK